MRGERHGVRPRRPLAPHRKPVRRCAEEVDLRLRQPGHRDPLHQEDEQHHEPGVPALPLPAGRGQRDGQPQLARRLCREDREGDVHADGPAGRHVPEPVQRSARAGPQQGDGHHVDA